MTTTDQPAMPENGVKTDGQTKPNKQQPPSETLAGPMMSVASGVRVYGDPVVTQGRTIIPVAMVAMGFRGGFWGRLQGVLGEATADKGLAASEGQGQGGVMRRMMIRPVGYIDITPTKSRFVTIGPGRFVALGFGLAFALGGLMMGGRRRMRRNH